MEKTKFHKECNNCKKTFTAKSTFYDHKKNCGSKPVAVCECGKHFFELSACDAHKKLCKHSGVEGKKFPNYTCQEENCSFFTNLRVDFVKHLEEVHSIHHEREMKTFQNYSEFEDWKESYEKASTSAFCIARTWNNSMGKFKDFVCNRSGRYESKSTGRRSIKSQGTSKIGFKCPANIKVQLHEISGTVSATVNPTHYGHEKKLAHLRLSNADRLNIASQLSLGVDSSHILRSSFTGHLQRQHLATSKDLRNISKAYGIERVGKRKRKKDSASNDVHVKNIVENEKDILYKRQIMGENHIALKSLEWLFGCWKAVDSSVSYPTMSSMHFVEEMEFIPTTQPVLQYRSKTWHPTKKCLMHCEGGFLRVDADTKAVALMVAHNFGATEISEGHLDDENKLFLESVCIGRMSFTKKESLKSLTRLWKMEKDTLVYKMEMETLDNPLQQHLSVTYRKLSGAGDG